MTVASRLLRDERQPLREVAHRVGYDSEFAFARLAGLTHTLAARRYARLAAAD